MASLARQTSVPLAVWRAIRGPADVLTAVRCGAASFLVVDLEQVGGIVPARACPPLPRRRASCRSWAAARHWESPRPPCFTWPPPPRLLHRQ